MKFIKLTTVTNNETYFLNCEKIFTIIQRKDKTDIFTENGPPTHFSLETAEDIIKMINVENNISTNPCENCEYGNCAY